MRHDIESCDQGGENQDKTWLDGPVVSIKGPVMTLMLRLIVTDQTRPVMTGTLLEMIVRWGPAFGHFEQLCLVIT